MKKIFSVVIFTILLSIIILPLSVLAYDYSEYKSYSYFDKDLATSAPKAYEYKYCINSDIASDGIVSEFSDIAFHEQKLFLLEKNIGRIIVTDQSGKYLKTIANNIGLNKPEGLFMASNGNIYIADTGNARVVKTDNEGNLIKVIPSPDPKLTLSEIDYAPIKVLVDAAERLYVLSKDETNGIFQLDLDGNFLGFFGSVPIVPSMSEIFWRTFSTKEQLARMLLFIPTEYSSMDIDEEGFIYTTVDTNSDTEMQSFLSSKSNQLAPIRRLNPKGKDIMLRNGVIPPMGDAIFGTVGDNKTAGASKLTDIAVKDNGIYSVLDIRHSRIFTYDSDGNLLYLFGESGKKTGQIQNAVAIAYCGNDIAVIDSNNSVKFYRQTEYARLIDRAVIYEKQGDYVEAENCWDELLKINSGSRLAYLGKAREALRKKDFATAMEYYIFVDDKDGYSEAFQLYRQDLGFKLTFPVIAGVIIFLILFAILKYRRSKKPKLEKKAREGKFKSYMQKVKYGFYIMRHPFDGFWDMVFEKRGSTAAASGILGAVILLNLISMVCSGYIVTGDYSNSENLLFKGIMGIVIPIALWCVANWSVTSLMNGSGTFKNVYMYTCYALSPMLIGLPLLTVLSNFISNDEMALYSIIQILMYIWVAFLLFVGTVTVHQYTAGKAVLAILIIFIGIGIIVFLFLLCITVGQQMTGFIERLWEEIRMRS